jgi:hypothetical protein
MSNSGIGAVDDALRKIHARVTALGTPKECDVPAAQPIAPVAAPGHARSSLSVSA